MTTDYVVWLKTLNPNHTEYTEVSIVLIDVCVLSKIITMDNTNDVNT